MTDAVPRTITVHFGPDDAVEVLIRLGEDGTATLDGEQARTLLLRTLATPALVEQLRALVRGDLPLEALGGDEDGPRSTGGRVYRL